MAGSVDEEALHQLYLWVDNIPLSRPKRNLSRDFSDGGVRPSVCACARVPLCVRVCLHVLSCNMGYCRSLCAYMSSLCLCACVGGVFGGCLTIF